MPNGNAVGAAELSAAPVVADGSTPLRTLLSEDGGILGVMHELDTYAFEQIRTPAITTDEQMDIAMMHAATDALCYIIVPAAEAGRGQENLWIVCRSEGHLWRWAICTDGEFALMWADNPWLQELPQLFLWR